MLRKFIAGLFIIIPSVSFSQSLKPVMDYMRLDAKVNDPLYTTYAAPISRSRLYGDKAYKMDYYSDCRPVTYSSDHAGNMFCIWKFDEIVVNKTADFLVKPIVRYSFPDMVIMDYVPFRGIMVTETFIVHSSKIAIVDMQVRNTDKIPHEVTVYPILELENDSLNIVRYDKIHSGYITHRYESPYRLISSLKTEYGYPTKTRDFFTANQKVNSFGGYTGDMSDFYNVIKTDFYSDKRADSLNMKQAGFVRFIAIQLKKRLKPGESVNFRYLRGVQSQEENIDSLMNETDLLKNTLLKGYFDDNLFLFSKIPLIKFKSKDEKLAYIGAFNLVRGCMYPGSGKTKYNFYAFSRNPLWGWGHGHQVLHESLVCLPIATWIQNLPRHHKGYIWSSRIQAALSLTGTDPGECRLILTRACQQPRHHFFPGSTGKFIMLAKTDNFFQMRTHQEQNILTGLLKTGMLTTMEPMNGALTGSLKM